MAKFAKFDVYDCFKVPSNGAEGQIQGVGVGWSPAGREVIYTVMWFHLVGSFEYKAVDVDDVWEHIQSKSNPHFTIGYVDPNDKRPPDFETNFVIADRSLRNIPIEVSVVSYGEESPCEHQWVHYNGFNDYFDYCKKCDEKRRT